MRSMVTLYLEVMEESETNSVLAEGVVAEEDSST